jgi:hypothetical protein
MKHIMALNFNHAKNNQDQIIQFNGVDIRLTILGCNFNPDLMAEIIKRYDGEVDVFAISGVPPRIKLGKNIKRIQLPRGFSIYPRNQLFSTEQSLKKHIGLGP